MVLVFVSKRSYRKGGETLGTTGTLETLLWLLQNDPALIDFLPIVPVSAARLAAVLVAKGVRASPEGVSAGDRNRLSQLQGLLHQFGGHFGELKNCRPHRGDPRPLGYRPVRKMCREIDKLLYPELHGQHTRPTGTW